MTGGQTFINFFKNNENRANVGDKYFLEGGFDMNVQILFYIFTFTNVIFILFYYNEIKKEF